MIHSKFLITKTCNDEKCKRYNQSLLLAGLLSMPFFGKAQNLKVQKDFVNQLLVVTYQASYVQYFIPLEQKTNFIALGISGPGIDVSESLGPDQAVPGEHTYIYALPLPKYAAEITVKLREYKNNHDQSGEFLRKDSITLTVEMNWHPDNFTIISDVKPNQYAEENSGILMEQVVSFDGVAEPHMISQVMSQKETHLYVPQGSTRYVDINFPKSAYDEAYSLVLGDQHQKAEWLNLFFNTTGWHSDYHAVTVGLPNQANLDDENISRSCICDYSRIQKRRSVCENSSHT